ncbi:MAG: matrixin family metalloprotease [Myxococcales bacterium]|nr:matrixin family metalloprotease [Myxococcales bacterium]MDD9964877.1 matrixin family metalloprotease [Myxococcales bacterium]
MGVPLAWSTPCASYSLVHHDNDALSFEEIRDAVDFSFQAWTGTECDGRPVALETAQTEALSECPEPAHNQSAGNVNTIAFVANWEAEGFEPEALALTKVWHDSTTGNILGADMLLNQDMGEYADCGNQPCPGKVDIENVVTHEAGHFLGLGHSEEADATMYFTADRGEVKKRGLHADDIAGLCALYGPQDEDPVCKPHDFVPPGGFEPTCDPAPETGCSCRLLGSPTTRRTGPWVVLLLPITLLWRRRAARKRQHLSTSE